jgi:hypothetical protein
MKKILIAFSTILLISLIGIVLTSSNNKEKSYLVNDDLAIHIFSPDPDETLSFPIMIEGEARGSWFFEGDFPVTVLDEEGKSLLVTYAVAQADWMTDEFVPFSLSITDLDWGGSQYGTLLFMKDSPERETGIIPQEPWPITFPLRADYRQVNLYWESVQGNETCLADNFSYRLYKDDENLIPNVLIGLLEGPSVQESNFLVSSSINNGVQLLDFSITSGIATVTVTENIDLQIAGSCLVNSIRTQIEQTLTQFDEIDAVNLKSDSRSTGEILQP